MNYIKLLEHYFHYLLKKNYIRKFFLLIEGDIYYEKRAIEIILKDKKVKCLFTSNLLFGGIDNELQYSEVK